MAVPKVASACLLFLTLALAAPGAAPALAPAGGAAVQAPDPVGHASGDSEPTPLRLDLGYQDVLGARGLVSRLDAHLRATEGALPGTVVRLEAEDVLLLSDETQTVNLPAGQQVTVSFLFLVLGPGPHFLGVTASQGAVVAFRQGWVDVPPLVVGTELVAPAVFYPDHLPAPVVAGDLGPLDSPPLDTRPASHDGPEPGPFVGNPLPLAVDVGEAFPAGAAAGDPGILNHQFRAAACWHFHDNVTWQRQRWATWALMDAEPGVDELLDSGVTGSNGCLLSDLVDRYEAPGNPRDLYMAFYACNTVVCTVTEAEGREPGNTYYWTSINDLQSGAAVPAVWDLGNVGPGDSRFANRVFQFVNSAWAWMVGLGSVDPDTLGFIWQIVPGSVSLAPCVCFDASNDLHMYMKVDGVRDVSPDTAGHEYGHWLMYKAYGGFPPGSGGTHSWCELSQAPGLAWSEGFAHFVGARASYELVHLVAVPVPGADGDTKQRTRDVETETCGEGGSDNEMKVARTLWDLRDTQDDGYDWGSWNLPAMLGLVENCVHDRLRDYYDMEVCSWDAFGYNQCHFLRSAFQNDYDFNFAPLVAVTSQGSTQWVAGDVQVAASVFDVDACAPSVEFRVSVDTTCDANDPVVGSDGTSPFAVGWDTTGFANGVGYYTCARGSDTMEDDWDRSAGQARPDNLGPVQGIDLGGIQGGGGWWRSAVTVSYPCSDAHSGVASHSFALDGAPMQPYQGPVLVAAQGGHTASGSCSDLVGHGAGSGAAFSIDTTPPDTDAVTAGAKGDGPWWLSAVSITLDCLDAYSGCASAQYRLDGGPFQAYTGAIPVASEGPHLLEYRSTDVAGNVEPLEGYSFAIDLGLPQLSVAFQGTQGTNGWWRSSVLVTIGCTDGVSGVASLTYILDGVPSPYTQPFSIAQQGTHALNVACDDAAGHTSASGHVVRIDTRPPSASLNVVVSPGGFRVDWTASDGTSGLASMSILETFENGVPTVLCSPAVSGPSASGSCPRTPTQEGTYCYTARVTDVAGNVFSTSPSCATW